MKYFAFIILLLILPIFPDIVGNPLFIESRIGVPSELFLIISIILFCILRIYKKFYFKKPLSSILLLASVIFAVISAISTIIDYYTYTNFVYNLTRLNYDKLLYLSLLLGILSIGSFSFAFFNKHYKILIFFTPIFLSFIGFLTWMWPFDKMYYLTKEDSFVEYSQFIALILGSVFAFRLALRLKNNSKLFMITYFLIAIILFMIAGDEISWRQRLLNLKTPENLRAINNQGEITIHNISAYEVYVTYGYILLGFYGSIVSYILLRLLQLKSKIFLLIPNFLFFYFLIPVIINLIFLIVEHNLKGFAEISELILYMGIAIFIIQLFYFCKVTYPPKKITLI